MRLALFSCVLICPLNPLLAQETELPSRAQKALDRYQSSAVKANEELAAAEQRRTEQLNNARNILISQLERSLTSRLSAAEQVSIYRHILTYDRHHHDARAFYEQLGLLDTVLNELEAEAPTDLLGNPAPPQAKQKQLTPGLYSVSGSRNFTIVVDGQGHFGKLSGELVYDDESFRMIWENGVTYYFNYVTREGTRSAGGVVAIKALE